MELLWLLFIFYGIYKLLTKAQRQFPPEPVGTGRPRFPGQELPGYDGDAMEYTARKSGDREGPVVITEDVPLSGPWSKSPQREEDTLLAGPWSRGNDASKGEARGEETPLPGPWSKPRDAGDVALPCPRSEPEEVPVPLPQEPARRDQPPVRRERPGQRMGNRPSGSAWETSNEEVRSGRYGDKGKEAEVCPVGIEQKREDRQKREGYPGRPGGMRRTGILCSGMFQPNNLINAIILSEVLGSRGGKNGQRKRIGWHK